MSAVPRQACCPPRLGELRDEIDRLDQVLIETLAQRLRIASHVLEEKRAAGLPVLDPSREAEVVRRAAERSRVRGIDEEEVRHIFWRIIGMTRRAQCEDGHA